jgi:microsomal dipeptidase-like Zn-dependent dipeptidase
MIDVSHASASTVEQVLDRVKVPIIASHSSAYAICAHERNLSDELIRRIAERGGVVQVCLYAGFISSDESEASVQRAADHIDHIVSIAGIGAVGIGSDFDGDGMLLGCAGSNDLINLTIELLRRGYMAEQVQKIWGANLLRVMDQVQHFAQENRNK